MNKLLGANFSRLWKNKYFWFCLGAMFLYLVFYMISCYRIVLLDGTDQEVKLENYYFQFSLVIGLFSAVFSALFLGQEYSDGTIRNKIIAGHSRKNIYLSQMILLFGASLLMLFAGMAGGLAGVPVFGFWEMGTMELFFYFLIPVLFTLAFCSIYTYINTLTQNRTLAAILCILVFFALLLLAGKFQEILSQPEIVFSEIQITGGEVNFSDPMPNPRYVSGTKREIFDFLMDFLPTGQSVSVAYRKVGHPVRMLLSSLGLTVLVTFCGIFQFERKDLK